MRMVAEGFARVPLHAEEMEIVIALEGAVVLADPVHFLAHERLDDRGGDFRVVIAAQRVADIVEQRHHDVLLVAPVAMRASRGLEGMLQPADREAAEIAVEQLEMIENPVRQPFGESAVFASDDRPILGGAFLHFAKRRTLLGVLGGGMQCVCSLHQSSPRTPAISHRRKLRKSLGERARLR